MLEDVNVTAVLSVIEKDNYALRDRRFPRHFLTRKISGSAYYHFPDAGDSGSLSFRAGPGDIVLIPAGTRYSVDLVEPGRYLSVGFTTQGGSLTPQIIRGVSQTKSLQLIEKMKATWIFQGQETALELKALLYELLAECVRCGRTAYHSSRQIARIRTALDYLEEHIFDADLTVEALSTQCGISDVYFRKLFQSVYQTTPSSYIINSRITYARSILEEDPQIKVAELAELVGYEDPFYFSRIFKRLVGIAPQKYQAMCRCLRTDAQPEDDL